MFRKIFWKIINFSVPIEKEVTRTDEKEKKSQELHPTDYNLLIAQDLWQAHYQILYIILLKGIHKIKCKYRHDNNVKNVESNAKIASAVLNTKTLKKI